MHIRIKSQHLIRTNTCYRRSCNGHPLLNQPSERVQHGPLKLLLQERARISSKPAPHTSSAHLVQKLLCLHKSNFSCYFCKRIRRGLYVHPRGGGGRGVPRRFWK
ncbi:hypothetical protein CEXT_100721 [Caerostris extrusa]|uniref:Uncharacterized protein n=1 Tax=Caerostris extrusa TaxID=172846 RepID=A0AAV4W7W8_CAEEX|nr:hypothetical protein CEXT_100721 [Caerostris extrusa]